MEAHAKARFARKVLHYWSGDRSTHPIEDYSGSGYKTLGMTKEVAEQEFKKVTAQILVAAEAIDIDIRDGMQEEVID